MPNFETNPNEKKAEFTFEDSALPWEPLQKELNELEKKLTNLPPDGKLTNEELKRLNELRQVAAESRKMKEEQFKEKIKDLPL